VLGLDDGGQEGEVVVGGCVGVPVRSDDEDDEDADDGDSEWMQLRRLHLGGYDIGLVPKDWVQTDDSPLPPLSVLAAGGRPGPAHGHVDDDDPHAGGFVRNENTASRRGLQQMFCLPLR